MSLISLQFDVAAESFVSLQGRAYQTRRRSTEIEVEKGLLVGGIYNGKNLNPLDQYLLDRSIICCRAWGINVAKRLTLDLPNINNGDEEDFVEPTLSFSTDLVMLGLISRWSLAMPRNVGAPYDPLKPYNPRSPYNPILGSKHHDRKDAWLTALERTGAKFAFTLGYDHSEITARDLQSPLYTQIPLPFSDPLMQALVRKDLASRIQSFTP